MGRRSKGIRYMAPLFDVISLSNSTLTNHSIASITSPFSAKLQVAFFFSGIWVVHILAIHSPTPVDFRSNPGRTILTILSPVHCGFPSTVSFFLYVYNSCQACCRRQPNLGDATRAGAIAIRIPNGYVSALEENELTWRRLSGSIPFVEFTETGQQRQPNNQYLRNTTLYSIPPMSRTANSRLTLIPSSNKLKTTIAILQLIYTAFTAYAMYGPIIADYGLSSPFIIALPCLHMSFLNLIANLVQGSYTHITVISPMREELSLADTADLLRAIHSPNVDGGVIESQRRVSGAPIGPRVGDDHQGNLPPSRTERKREFDGWLERNYPQIEFNTPSFLQSAAAGPASRIFLLHNTLALFVMLTWIGLLTGFRAGTRVTKYFILLAVLLDSVLHILVALILSACRRRKRFGRKSVLIVMVVVTITVCSVNLVGCLVSGKLLYQIYAGSNPI